MMLGAYGLAATASLFSGNPLVAIAASLALALAAGFAVYAALMWRMTGESVLAAVLATIALGILLRGAMVLVFGTQTQYPLQGLGWTNASIALGASARISAAGLALILATATVYGGLFLFLRATRWGIRMRAAGQNPLLAAQRGIRLHGIYALAWGLATLTGGMAGLLIAGDPRHQTTLRTIRLEAFPAAPGGGLQNSAGALGCSPLRASAGGL